MKGKYDEATKEEARELWDAGWGLAAIARELGVASPSQVKTWVSPEDYRKQLRRQRAYRRVHKNRNRGPEYGRVYREAHREQIRQNAVDARRRNNYALDVGRRQILIGQLISGLRAVLEENHDPEHPTVFTPIRPRGGQ